MRKLYISSGLALLLLLTQFGAILHEVSHIIRVGTNVHVQVHTDTAALDKGCRLCLGFSQLSNPAGNTVDVVNFEPSSCSATPAPPCSIIPSDVLAPRSRGPPLSHPNV